ncbi:putative zinc-binding protein [uncultured Microbulbifer sp.]|uniref:putative zinc-binding protein n=1 Tax=uncultured Microbulbifer sp. TaxID=348147 RepID=UPI0025FF2E16|nr:putative zinc-binding protein [uncultured Microbulbifer sp.]
MTNKSSYRELPLVYACSGCSSAAQLTNALAVRLDRAKLAEMSCIAGVGGEVPALLRIATAERPKVVLDGCPLHCARSCLQRQGIAPDLHIDLSREGIRKKMHADPTVEEIERILQTVVSPRIAALLST